jgi:hypothetical protein
MYIYIFFFLNQWNIRTYLDTPGGVRVKKELCDVCAVPGHKAGMLLSEYPPQGEDFTIGRLGLKSMPLPPLYSGGGVEWCIFIHQSTALSK